MGKENEGEGAAEKQASLRLDQRHKIPSGLVGVTPTLPPTSRA